MDTGDPSSHPYKSLRLELAPPVPWLICDRKDTPVVAGFWMIQPSLILNLGKDWMREGGPVVTTEVFVKLCRWASPSP